MLNALPAGGPSVERLQIRQPIFSLNAMVCTHVVDICNSILTPYTWSRALICKTICNAALTQFHASTKKNPHQLPITNRLDTGRDVRYRLGPSCISAPYVSPRKPRMCLIPPSEACRNGRLDTCLSLLEAFLEVLCNGATALGNMICSIPPNRWSS